MSSALLLLSAPYGKPLPILDDRLASTDGCKNPLDRAFAGSHAVRAMRWSEWARHMSQVRTA